MTAILFLGHQIEMFARAAVSILYHYTNALDG